MDFIAGLSEWGYIGLFIAGFLAGSILPFSSEVVLGLLLYAGYNEWGCLASATAGNWLGGVTCYYIGRLGKVEWIEKYLHVQKESLDKAQHFMADRGAWMGSFAFLPLLGSAITIVLGLTRANIVISVISITIGKVLRYVLLVYGLSFIF